MYTDYYSNKADPERWDRLENNMLHGSDLMVWHDGGPLEGTGAMVAILSERKIGIALIANGTSFSEVFLSHLQ